MTYMTTSNAVEEWDVPPRRSVSGRDDQAAGFFRFRLVFLVAAGRHSRSHGANSEVGRQDRPIAAAMPTKHVVLESSMLATLSYDDERQHLDVEFRGGRRYRYFEVPEIVFAALMKAPTKGTFFNERIRDAFYSQRF